MRAHTELGALHRELTTNLGPLAEGDQTRELLDLLFAWGFARLGASSEAAALAAPATEALREAQYVPWLIARVFAFRMKEPGADDWPGELTDAYFALPPFGQYQSGRTLRAAWALEPWRDFWHDVSRDHFSMTLKGITDHWPPPAEWPRLAPFDPISGDELLSRIRAAPELGSKSRRGWPTGKATIIREALRRAAPSGLEVVIAGLEEVRKDWPPEPDGMSTSRNLWSLAHVTLADAMVFAIAESVQPLVVPA